MLKYQMLYEEQQYEAFCYSEVKTLSLRVLHTKAALGRADAVVTELKAELACVKGQAEKSMTEEEEKTKKPVEKVVAVEKASLQKLFQEKVGEVDAKVVLVRQHDPLCARATAELYFGGAKDYYTKMKRPGEGLDSEEPETKRRRVTTNNLNLDTSRPLKKRVILSKYKNLIEFMKGDKRAISTQVSFWRSRYDSNAEAATIELLVLIIETFLSKIPTKEELLKNYNISEEKLTLYRIDYPVLLDTPVSQVHTVVRSITTMAERLGKEDLFIRQPSDKFKDNLLLFWDELVHNCEKQTLANPNGILFDKNLFNKCMDYIIALSWSVTRVYRETAISMGYQLLQSYIDVAKSKFGEISGRKYDVREENNLVNFTMIHRITVLEEMIEKMFGGLFDRRFSDKDQNIRKFCIVALGKLILSYPEKFLKDSRLEYLGRTLIDKSAEVRKASICAMKNIYKVNSEVPALGVLTEAISKRMAELANDMNIPVAVCVIHIVQNLIRYQPDARLNDLYALLIHDPVSIRHTIRKLVYEYSIRQDNVSSSGVEGDENNSPEVHVHRILKILKEFSGDRILIIYVIDHIWEYMAEMEYQEKKKNDGSYFSRIWECIVSMLLKEDPSTEKDEQDATNLLWLLCASVKKAVGERIVPATDIQKPSYNIEELELFEQNKRDATFTIMKKYPKLLSKFIDNRANVQPLIEIILHMDREVYLKMDQEKELEQVPALIKNIFNKHNEKEVLRVCVKAMVHWNSNGPDYARVICKDLQDNLRTMVSKEKEVDDNTLLEILKKLYEIQLSVDVGSTVFYADLESVLDGGKRSEEVTSFFLLNMLMCLKACVYSKINSDGPEEMKGWEVLVVTRDSLSKRLVNILISQELKGSSASWLCVILSEFWSLCKLKITCSKEQGLWEYVPDESCLEKYWHLCLQQLCISAAVNKEYVEETSRDAVMIAAIPWIVSNKISKAKEYLCPEISQLLVHGISLTETYEHLIKFLQKHGDLPPIFLELKMYPLEMAEFDKLLLTYLEKVKD